MIIVVDGDRLLEDHVIRAARVDRRNVGIVVDHVISANEVVGVRNPIRPPVARTLKQDDRRVHGTAGEDE
jgi:hypothetical protein